MSTVEKKRDLSYMSEAQLLKFRQDTVTHICSYQWQYFFTLTFNNKMECRDEVEGIVGKFINVLSAMVFGSRSKKRVNCYSVAEHHESGGLHVHLLIEDVTIRITNENIIKDFHLPEKVHDAWMRCSSNTSSPSKARYTIENRWFEIVYDIDYLANYITKEMKKRINPVLSGQLTLKGRRFQ